MRRRELLHRLAMAALLPSAGSAFAQSDLKKLVVGFAPGTATDGLARLLADRMKGSYGSNLIVENRVGAGGQLAAVAVKSAPADGAAVLVTALSVLSVNPHTFSKVAYAPSDFLPVGNAVTTDFAFAVGPAVPNSITTVSQFLDWCKANPGNANFATGATGSKLHFAGIKLGLEAGVKLTHIGYNNSGTALTDLAGGTVPAYVGVVPTVVPFLNRIRVLATMGESRSRFLPDVPTFVEAGYKNMVINETFGLYLPAQTPDDQAARLHAAMTAALATADALKALSVLGMEATPSTAAAHAAQVKREFDQWGRFVKQIGFKHDS